MLLKKLAAVGLMALIVVGFAAADTALLYRAFARRQFVIDELERLAGRRVTLGGISFGPFKGLVAESFEIPKRNGQSLLRADRIRVQLDRSRLLSGTVRISSIELEKPLVRLEISRDGRSELFELVSEVARHARESGTAGGPIPKISVTGGTFVFVHEALMKEGLELGVHDVDARILPYDSSEFVVQGAADAGVLGRWRIEGRIDAATGRSEVRIGTKGLVLGPGSVAAFGPEVQRVYGMYNVAGPVDAEILGSYDPQDAKPVSVTAEVQPRGIEIEYANFRYKVRNVRGLVRLKDDGIEFQNMTARFRENDPDGEPGNPHGGEPPIDLAMSGSTEGYVAESAYTLRFNIENLPISRKLRGALQASAQNVYDLFEPAGLLRGKVDVTKPHGAGRPVTHNIEMNMVDCTATFKPFPLPVEDVSGLIVLRGDELRIENARCRNREAWFTVNGSLTSIEADGGIEVTVDCESLLLTPDESADPRARALPPAVREIWRHFTPAGSVSVHWVTKRAPGPGRELTYDVTVRPRDLKASFDGIPYALAGIEGEVWTDARRVEIRRLEGKHGEASVRIRGEIAGLESDPSYDLTISASRVPIDGDLRAALPPEFTAILADMKLAGTLDMDDLRFLKGGEDLEPGTSLYEAKSIRLQDGRFDAGLEFREVKEVDLTARGVLTRESHTVLGRIKDASLRIEDVMVTDLRANYRFAKGDLRIDDIEGTCYDGRVTGSVLYNTPSSEWNIGIRAANVDLMQFTSDRKTMAGKNVTGRADGDLQIRGTGSRASGFTGAGNISLKDSDLYEVPLLVSVFNVLDFAEKKDVFRKGSVRFDVEDSRFQVRDLRLESDSMDLESDRGELDFDGNIRLKMSPRMNKVFLKPLNALMAVYITGTLANPEPKLMPTLDIDAILPKPKRK